MSSVSSCDSNYKFPAHVARAYNIPQAKPNAFANAQSLAANGANEAQRNDGPFSIPTPGASRNDSVSASTSQRIVNDLVAAKVDSSAAPWVSDASAHAPQLATASGSLPLYRRAADRIEAAVGIAVGRSLDVKG
ncbi:MAG TPA: hypothetical protein VG711_10435 [Phycisphaerales bacterium]|nr:hypothetical protein [Phycisphaerales bacterium]